MSAAESNLAYLTTVEQERTHDSVAVEEPLEVRLSWGPALGPGRGVAVTMRTPGDDLELAIGFLHAEGIIRAREDVESIRHTGPAIRADGTSDVVKVQLRRGAQVDLARLERNVYMSSSCGVLGKASLESVRTQQPPPIAVGPIVSPTTIHSLPRRLRRHESVFDRSGGLYAAALFDGRGRLIRVREDVGRHNAVDKVLGAELMAGRLPRANGLLFVNGRASFEIVQKALMAGVPIIAAFGAPSSLAIDLALEHGMTLLGFVRDGLFNVYSGAIRIDDH